MRVLAMQGSGILAGMKTVVIWAIAHLIIASMVTDWMREQGKTEEEAKFAGHLAGAATGYALTRAL
jgi:hypothetical protein